MPVPAGLNPWAVRAKVGTIRAERRRGSAGATSELSPGSGAEVDQVNLEDIRHVHSGRR